MNSIVLSAIPKN
jgi:hypothetical protein